MANLANTSYDERPAPIGAGVTVVADRRATAVGATGAGTAQNDTIELAVIPAGHVPVGGFIVVPDLDTATTWAASLGLLNAGKTDLSTAAADGGAVLASALTTGQAGGVLQLSSYAVLASIQPVDYDRVLAFKVTTAPTAQAGTIRTVLLTAPVA